MQLAKIDDQINRMKSLLEKYEYTEQEKEIKTSFLVGYVTACHEAELISKNEYQAFIYQIAALWYSKILATFLGLQFI